MNAVNHVHSPVVEIEWTSNGEHSVNLTSFHLYTALVMQLAHNVLYVVTVNFRLLVPS